MNRLVIDNDFETNDVCVKFFTPFGDMEAERRHTDVFKTFHSLFRQWFGEKMSAMNYVTYFGNVDEDMLTMCRHIMDDNMFAALQKLPEEQHNAFCLTLFAFYDFLNKTEQMFSTKVLRIDVSRVPIEYWFNFRKCEMGIELAMQQLIPLINDVKTITIMLNKFIAAYRELAEDPTWRALYTFVMLNMINVLDRVTFRPNMRSIGAFVNITDEVEQMLR